MLQKGRLNATQSAEMGQVYLVGLP